MFMFTIVAGFSAPQASAANLSDISRHWAQSQINDLVNKGIISGYPDNTFKPENAITRAELAVMVNKLSHLLTLRILISKTSNPQTGLRPKLPRLKLQATFLVTRTEP